MELCRLVPPDGAVSELKHPEPAQIYEGWNFNSGNYLFTTDTK